MPYDSNNIFAKIIRKEIPANIVYEDEKILAFHDINPVAPHHILVIPKGEYISFDDFAENSDAENISYFFKKTQEIANKFKLQKSGYRIISNHGKEASQTVAHFHVHIIAGKPLGGLISEDNFIR